VGDAPLDKLGEAAQQIVEMYKAAFDRRPTRAEWEALLLGILGTEASEVQYVEDGAVKRVRLESKS
jgi:hypothetical protein